MPRIPPLALGHSEHARREFRDLGVWGDQTIAEVVDAVAERDGTRAAIRDGSIDWTYAQLCDFSKRLARILLDMGVRPEDAVAAQLPSCALLPATHLACNRIGALFLPMSPNWREREVAGLLSSVEAPVLLAVDHDRDFDLKEMHARLRGELPHLREIVYARTDGPESLEARTAAAAPLSTAESEKLMPGADDPGHVMVSSGTTGIPKASVWSSNDALALARHTVSALELTQDDIVAGLAPASLGSTGYVFPVLAPLTVGAQSVLLESWSPAAALELIVTRRCTAATAVPTQMVMLLDLDLEAHDLSAFQRFNNAGAPLSPTAAEQVEARFGCRVQTVYGSTDGGVPVMTRISDPEIQRRTSVGRVCAGQELELRAADGTPAADGVPGEICWRGATKSYGYFNQPDYDAAAFDADGWFCSGDLGLIDADGYLRIVGRTKDMILRGGVNIFPSDIESVLQECPGLTQVAIVGVPDERLGERICVVAVPGSGAGTSLEDVCTFLTERGLARYKHPEFLVEMDKFPVNAGAKLDREAIRTFAIAQIAQTAEPQ